MLAGEAPLGFGSPGGELTIEYDEEALRHFDSAFNRHRPTPAYYGWHSQVDKASKLNERAF